MVEYEEKGVVATIRMARGKGNALNFDLVTALLNALDRYESSSSRAGIITGQGSSFCAGVDLHTLVDGGPEYVRRFLPQMARMFERLAEFPKPLIGAINGHAIAAGAMIMLTCDQRLLARGTARVGLTEVRVGVVFSGRALEIARFATPPQHFSTLICTGRTWPPDEALSRGLVDELVDADRLLDRAREVADELAAISSTTFSTTKLAVRRPMLEAARAQGARTDAAVLEHWCSPEVLAQAAKFAAQTIRRHDAATK